MRIVIVEDFQLIADMVAIACRQLQPQAEVVKMPTAERALSDCRKQPPDLIFLDLVLPDRDGITAIPEFFAAAPGAKIIALTGHADEVTLHRALAARIHGFIDKNEAPLDELKEAIDTVMAGKTYLSPAARRLKESLHADPTAFNKLLSPHEQKLLALFGDGLTNEDVAERTGISASTVKVHRRNIMSKLDVHSTPQLILYALEKGFTRLKRDSGSRSPSDS